MEACVAYPDLLDSFENAGQFQKGSYTPLVSK